MGIGKPGHSSRSGCDTYKVDPREPRTSAFIALVLGALTLVAGTLLGWTDLLDRLVVSPPTPVRALMAASAGVLGGWLVLRAADRIRSTGTARDMIRGVRLAFLAVAAFSAAAGWAVGSALPIVAALIIAGVDVLETSFLLIVAAARTER
jgi:hypothetical protein